MASQVPPQKGVAYTFYIALVSQSDTDVFKTSVTLAEGDVKVSKDGGSFTNITTLPTEIGTSGVVAVSLSATEMNADRVVVLFHDAAGNEWQDAMVCIDTASKLIDDLSVLTTADVNAECDTALADYDPPTDAEMDAAFAAVPAAVWGHTSRRLTMTAAEMAAAVSGSAISIHRGDSWQVTLTGLGDISARTKLYFTLKSSAIHADSDALIQIEESGGLLRLNGAAAESSADGSLEVDDETSGDITITLSAAITAQLTPATGLIYDVQMVTATGVDTLTAASATITADVTRAVS